MGESAASTANLAFNPAPIQDQDTPSLSDA
jgi:hypothetical protein